MTVQPTYPGVYIREVPSGNRTIVGVATSITAFLGRASRGPADEVVRITRYTDFERTFGALARNSGLGYAVQDFFLNGGGEALIVRVAHREATPAPASTPPRSGAATAPVKKSAASTTWESDLAKAGKLRVRASGPGSWAKDFKLKVDYPDDAEKADIAAGQGVGEDDLFNLEVDGGDAYGKETHRNLTLAEGPRRMDYVLRSSSALVRVDGTVPDITVTGAKRRPPSGDLGAPTIAGEDGDAPDSGDYERALAALGEADLVNLVCVPPVTPDGEVAKDVWTKAAQFCVDRRAFLLADPPASVDAAGVASWVTSNMGFNRDMARNAAFFFPRILRTDPLRGGTRSTMVPCGAIAGVFARTDATRGVWKAPAGIEAALADADPAVVLTDDQNGALNPKGINCIRRFRDSGTVVWGARTRRGADTLADDYKYIPVRRTALYLEETLLRNTQWAVFEPNDEPLWSQIRNSIGLFMQDLFRRGAFQGTSPRDAYFVLCGKDTTTQYDIDRGIVNIRVGFAPLKPAEFVVISIEQKTAQAS